MSVWQKMRRCEVLAPTLLVCVLVLMGTFLAQPAHAEEPPERSPYSLVVGSFFPLGYTVGLQASVSDPVFVEANIGANLLLSQGVSYRAVLGARLYEGSVLSWSLWGGAMGAWLSEVPDFGYLSFEGLAALLVGHALGEGRLLMGPYDQSVAPVWATAGTSLKWDISQVGSPGVGIALDFGAMYLVNGSYHLDSNSLFRWNGDSQNTDGWAPVPTLGVRVHYEL